MPSARVRGRSVERIGRAKPFTVELPLELVIRFQETSYADGPANGGAERLDPITIRRVVHSALEVYPRLNSTVSLAVRCHPPRTVPSSFPRISDSPRNP